MLGQRTDWKIWTRLFEGDFRSYGGSGSSHYSRPTYDEVLAQGTPENTSVYIGNISQTASDDDVRSAFKRFGNVVDIRNFKTQGYSFVKFDTRENAARAIADMNGTEFMGQTIRCSWGKTDVNRSPSHLNSHILDRTHCWCRPGCRGCWFQWKCCCERSAATTILAILSALLQQPGRSTTMAGLLESSWYCWYSTSQLQPTPSTLIYLHFNM